MFLASPITFPNLGITVDPDPVAFTVFGKSIYWYGIIFAAAFLRQQTWQGKPEVKPLQQNKS